MPELKMFVMWKWWTDAGRSASSSPAPSLLCLGELASPLGRERIKFNAPVFSSSLLQAAASKGFGRVTWVSAFEDRKVEPS